MLCHACISGIGMHPLGQVRVPEILEEGHTSSGRCWLAIADVTLHKASLALSEDLPSNAPLSMALGIEERGRRRTWNG